MFFSKPGEYEPCGMFSVGHFILLVLALSIVGIALSNTKNISKEKVKEMKKKGISKGDFQRIKKMIYGGYVKEYNDVQDIARMFLADYFFWINSFDYIEEIEGINVEYLNQVLNDVFKEEKMVLSIVKS